MNKKILILLFVIIFAGFTIRLNTALVSNIDSDEGNYIIDAKFLQDGEIPIRSVMFSVFLIPFTTLPVSILSMRLLPIIASSLTIIFIYLIGKRLWDERIGLLAAGIYAFTPFIVFYNVALFTENLQWLFVSAAIFFFIKGWQENKKWPFVLNGLLLGMAFLVRETAILIAAAEFAFLIYKRREIIGKFITTAGGAFLPFFVTYLFLPHMSFSYTNPMNINPIFNKLGISFWFILEGAALVFLGYLVSWTIIRRRNFDKGAIFLFFSLGTLAVFYYFISGKLHLHYFMEAAVLLSLLGAWAIWNFNSAWQFPIKKIIAALLILGVFSFSVYSVFGGFENYYPQDDIEKAARYVRASNEDEIFTANLAILYLAEKRPVANITHPAIFALGNRNALEEVGYPTPEELKEKLGRTIILDSYTRHVYFKYNPELESFIYKKYEKKMTYGEIEIFTR